MSKIHVRDVTDTTGFKGGDRRGDCVFCSQTVNDRGFRVHRGMGHEAMYICKTCGGVLEEKIADIGEIRDGRIGL